jgi:hemerythrin-like domain-containing protein
MPPEHKEKLMKPIGPLMREHRLIERMIVLLRDELVSIEENSRASISLIDAGVDLFRTYADRTHHGKEEDILFRDLARKDLADEHKLTMDELVQEHLYARRKVRELVAARDRYVGGDTEALGKMKENLQDLISFYPVHIQKEDKRFFFASMEYFDRQEQDAMLEEFADFDRRMIHEKYGALIESFEKLGHS